MVRSCQSLVFLAGVLVVWTAGCTGSHAPGKIKGTVTYNGQPLPAGNVTFHSESKGSYNAPLLRNGTYEVVDLPAVPMVVTVDTEFLNPNKKVPSYGGKKGQEAYMERLAAEKKGGAQIREDADPYTKIPAKYADKTATPLKMTVKAGRQEYNIDLAAN